MKCIAIIPIKKRSSRVKKKNFKIVNNKKLYQFFINKIRKCGFDKIYVDSDSSEIKNYCKKNKINFINRKSYLAKDSANGNDLLNYHRNLIKADIYFQLFITAPLLSVKTIKNCITFLKRNRNYDSILTTHEIHSWFWFKKKPVNYNPKTLPRSQDAKPVILETTGLYGITKNAVLKYKSRIGKKPYFHEVSDNENIDLDNEKDFKFLEFILNK